MFSVWEKYPDSRRLDHPDFGDVYKTTFAKGVIKEFKRLSDNPLRVTSQVKVEVNGELSDFLPLFYQPKEQYWDTEDHQARDYNEDGRYFENAWMSFRAGDEVSVLLRENQPWAVIGFADGYPRLGENILKIIFDTAQMDMNYMLWQFEGAEHYPEPGMNQEGGVLNPWNGTEEGPDGVPLGLTEKCPLVGEGFHAETGWQGVYWCEDWWPYNNGINPYVGQYVQGHEKVTLAGFDHYYYREWLVPCGPFMYLFSVISQHSNITRTDEHWIYVGDHWEYTGSSTTTTGEVRRTLDVRIAVKLFDKEAYEQMKNSVEDNPGFYQKWDDGEDWWVSRPGFQLDGSTGYFTMENYFPDGWAWDAKLAIWTSEDGDPPINVPPEEWVLRKYVPCWEGAEFFVRPHNPESSEAA